MLNSSKWQVYIMYLCSNSYIFFTILRGVAKISFHSGYKIDILRYDGLKFGCTIQCDRTNNIMMKSFKNI